MKQKLLISLSIYLLTYASSCGKNQNTLPLANDIDQITYDDEDLNPATGCSDATYDDWRTSEYILPFPTGETYRVNLSHCSGSYHSFGQPDQFAIDFAMPIGSTIVASRSGTVVAVVENGADGSFPNNLVAIDHGDGTVAQYMHLTFEGASVVFGEEIDQGQIIAKSGNTGLAGYPHLHFVVTKSRFSYPYESLPTTFRNTRANTKSLVAWTEYTALRFER